MKLKLQQVECFGGIFIKWGRKNRHYEENLSVHTKRYGAWKKLE